MQTSHETLRNALASAPLRRINEPMDVFIRRYYQWREIAMQALALAERDDASAPTDTPHPNEHGY